MSNRKVGHVWLVERRRLVLRSSMLFFFFFQAEDGIRDYKVTGVQTCALPIFLFGLPLIAGVLVTALDTLLVLWLSRYGIRLIEAVILSLIAIVTGCFLVELTLAKPLVHEIVNGLLPRINNQSLYIAIGILGATVMPHNLYLHSALVQT